MSKSYAEITAEINRGIVKLRRGAPDAMAGFSAMARIDERDGRASRPPDPAVPDARGAHLRASLRPAQAVSDAKSSHLT